MDDFRSKLPLIILVAGIGLGVLSLFFLNRFTRGNLAPTDSSAIYGGQVELGYTSTGFMLSYHGDGNVEVCGIGMINPNTAITAAHCVSDNIPRQIGLGGINYSVLSNREVAEVQIPAGWQPNSFETDVALIGIVEPLNIDQEIELVRPELGCNYTVVGYGLTEEDEGVSGGNYLRPRRSTAACITNIRGGLIFIEGDGGGVCFGDSGSPVYETGTNNFVGVISAILPNGNNRSDYCAVGNIAVAAIAQNYAGFIDGLEFETVATESPIVGNNYCDLNESVICPASSLCVNNGCEDTSEVNLSQEVEIVNQSLGTTDTLRNIFLLAAAVFGIVSITALLTIIRNSILNARGK